MKHFDYVESTKRGFMWYMVRQVKFALSRMGIMLAHKKQNNKKYNVSICAIFKNEGMFLCEWMEFHILIGVEHFYLYNNFSDDNYKEILEPYINNGVVTLIDWPVKYGQLQAYEDCFKRFKEETQWIAYIDLDEFICMHTETNVSHWIKQFSNYPCVHAFWKMFGTSGVIEHNPDIPVIEQYTACWPLLANIGKSFVNTDFNIDEFNCHLFYASIRVLGFKVKLLPVNEFKRFIHHWSANTPHKVDTGIQINHYYNRSYSQYVYKTTKRGDACSDGSQKGREDKNRFAREENRNTMRDYTIQRFLVQLKLRLNDYGKATSK